MFGFDTQRLWNDLLSCEWEEYGRMLSGLCVGMPLRKRYVCMMSECMPSCSFSSDFLTFVHLRTVRRIKAALFGANALVHVHATCPMKLA
jgi:hypothetical protein